MPVSQTPSLQEIVTFFQGPNDLASYVRGGTYVPDISANSAISTTVAGLSLAQFKGADKSTAVSIGTTQLTHSASASGTGQSSGETGVRIDMLPSGGNGTYSYSINVVSFTTSASGWSNPQMSGVSQDNVYIFSAFNGTVIAGRSVTAVATVDITLSSGGQTATKRFTINFSYTRTSSSGGGVEA